MADASDANPPCPDGLDPKVWQAMQAMNRFEEQDENGVDVSLIEWMLSLSTEERIRRGDAGAREHRRIQQMVQKQSPPSATWSRGSQGDESFSVFDGDG